MLSVDPPRPSVNQLISGVKPMVNQLTLGVTPLVNPLQP
jgi:hypothetical protein